MKHYIFGIVVPFVLLVISITLIVSGLKDEQKRYNKYVGKSLVINKDTMVIVDYSIFTSSVYLSNGAKVSIKFVESAIK